MDRTEGLKALKEAAERREFKKVPTGYLLRLMVIVLGGNNFEFGQKLDKLQEGTAIGTRVALTFANYWVVGRSFVGRIEGDHGGFVSDTLIICSSSGTERGRSCKSL